METTITKVAEYVANQIAHEFLVVEKTSLDSQGALDEYWLRVFSSNGEYKGCIHMEVLNSDNPPRIYVGFFDNQQPPFEPDCEELDVLLPLIVERIKLFS